MHFRSWARCWLVVILSFLCFCLWLLLCLPATALCDPVLVCRLQAASPHREHFRFRAFCSILPTCLDFVDVVISACFFCFFYDEVGYVDKCFFLSVLTVFFYCFMISSMHRVFYFENLPILYAVLSDFLPSSVCSVQLEVTSVKPTRSCSRLVTCWRVVKALCRCFLMPS